MLIPELLRLGVELQHGLHLELVVELGHLRFRLHHRSPRVDLPLAAHPVDLERLPEVLGVTDVKQFDVELDLVALGNEGAAEAARGHGVETAHGDDVGVVGAAVRVVGVASAVEVLVR